MTGLVGAAGGVGGFLLPTLLGGLKGLTGSFAGAFLLFALAGLACAVILAASARSGSANSSGAAGSRRSRRDAGAASGGIRSPAADRPAQWIRADDARYARPRESGPLASLFAPRLAGRGIGDLLRPRLARFRGDDRRRQGAGAQLGIAGRIGRRDHGHELLAPTRCRAARCPGNRRACRSPADARGVHCEAYRRPNMHSGNSVARSMSPSAIGLQSSIPAALYAFAVISMQYSAESSRPSS